MDKFKQFQISLKNNTNAMVIVIEPEKKDLYNSKKLNNEIKSLQNEFNITKENTKFLLLHQLPEYLIKKISNKSPAFVVFNKEKILLLQRGY